MESTSDMHPARAVDGALGTVWIVQACVGPPSNVQSYKGGEIVISRVGSNSAALSAPPKVSLVAPPATIGLCSHTGDGALAADDPWLKSGPWKPVSSVASASTVGSSSSVQVMDERIAKALDARLAMEVDDDVQAALSARVVALEQHVQSLATHQQQLETKIDDSSKQTEHRITTLQNQVGHELEKQSGQMQDLFAKQLRHIETLLARGPRE